MNTIQMCCPSLPDTMQKVKIHTDVQTFLRSYLQRDNRAVAMECRSSIPGNLIFSKSANVGDKNPVPH